MSEHIATLSWAADSADFKYRSFNRSHSWDFGHGVLVPASAAPDFLGSEERVDPEQAFTAALASCHMLTFLAIASMRGITVTSYQDRAIGHLEKGPERKPVITHIDLFPKITFAPDGEPDAATLAELHDRAHADCFLANSVKCTIKVNPSS